MNKNRSAPFFYVQVIAVTLLKALLRCVLTLSGSVIKSTDNRNTPVTGTRKVRHGGQHTGRSESAPGFDPSEELDPTQPGPALMTKPKHRRRLAALSYEVESTQLDSPRATTAGSNQNERPKISSS
jgi:hypothetical protein